MKEAQRNDGVMTASLGKSRSGKTSYVLAKIRGAKRLLVWDAEGQFGKLANCQTIRTAEELYQKVKRNNASFRLAFVSANLRQDFKLFCEIAYYAGVVAPLSVVAEELAAVSNAGKAPDEWGVLVRQGLKYGIDIYAIGQRIQEVDKTLIGNTSIVTQFMANERDIEKIIKDTGITPPVKPLQFVEKDNNTDTIKNGIVSFRNDKPVLGYKNKV